MKWFTLIEWHLYVLFLYFFSSFFKTVIELENTSHFVAFFFFFVYYYYIFIHILFFPSSLSLFLSFSFPLLFLLLFFASYLSFLFLSSDNLFIFPFFLFFYQSFLPCRISLIASIDILIIDVEEHIIQIFHM